MSLESRVKIRRSNRNLLRNLQPNIPRQRRTVLATTTLVQNPVLWVFEYHNRKGKLEGTSQKLEKATLIAYPS
ncbi:unnamed protein product [Thlaspi arvense]|uniref:Uncharacterized protein n=1 Tax=Thlaspi arvense TaxID=13288 RepID=A0AAU9SE26_THLAR|nr:unnamed protein product [Thlaspi arvense]